MDFLASIGLDRYTLEGIIKIVAAMVVGGLVGWERERGNQAAGLRTHVLVCMGACLIMAVSLWYVEQKGTGDAMRMGAQVVSGIGFLGAGTIIKGESGVKGLTTAASLWVVACIGLALGAGFYWGAILTAILTYAALVFFKSLEERAVRAHETLILRVEDNGRTAGETVQLLVRQKVRITDFHSEREKDRLQITIQAIFPKGREKDAQIMQQLMSVEGVISVKNG